MAKLDLGPWLKPVSQTQKLEDLEAETRWEASQVNGQNEEAQVSQWK